MTLTCAKFCYARSAPMAMHAVKKASKKSDMRVSCEAIPEEMCGTSPQPHPQHPQHPPAQHPHLMTYKSDPGECCTLLERSSRPPVGKHISLLCL